jgi:hypothetical protein
LILAEAADDVDGFDPILLCGLCGFPSRSSRLRAFNRKARKGFAKGTKKSAGKLKPRHHQIAGAVAG